MPGPTLLMKVLLGEMTFKQVHKAWKEEESMMEEKDSQPKLWWEKITLPCRRCTDLNKGKDVMKPLTAFASSQFNRTADDYWNKVVSKGADLICIKCVRNCEWIPTNIKKPRAVIPCDGCGKIRPDSWFSAEALQLWKTLSDDDIMCKSCSGEQVKHQTGNVIFCNGECQKELPEYHFMETFLVRWLAGDITEAKFARWWALEAGIPDKEAYACKHKLYITPELGSEIEYIREILSNSSV